MFQELSRQLAGEVIATIPEEYRRDFGNLKRRTPRLVIIPATALDVQAAVRFARRAGMRIVSRGHACSSYGQSLSDEILLDTRRLCALDQESESAVTAGAGCTWRGLQDFLVERGLTSPVVVSGEHATLGGTLSVGGFGPSSILQGSVIEHVLALDIVTGEGELVRAEPRGSHDRLFAYTLGGLGQCGIIVGVKLRVTQYKPYSLVEQRTFAADTDLLELAREVVAEEPDICRLVYLNAGQHWKLETGRSHTTRPALDMPSSLSRSSTLGNSSSLSGSSLLDGSSQPGASRSLVVTDYFRELFAREAVFTQRMSEAQVRRGMLKNATDARKIWSDFFLPAAGANEFFQSIREMFADPAIVIGLNGTILRPRPRAVDEERALPLLPLPQAELVHSMGPYCVLPPELVGEYLRRFEEAAAICLSLGGRQYLHGYQEGGENFYRRQFGAAVFEEWLAVKRRYDAGGILGAQLF